MCQTHICSIVPPHLLDAIAASNELSDDHRECARRSLALVQSLQERKAAFTKQLTQPRGYAQSSSARDFRRPTIVPDHFFQAILDSDDVDEETKANARKDLEHIQSVHASYQATQGAASARAEEQQHTMAAAAAKKGKGKTETTPSGAFYCAVYDAGHTEDENALPGTVKRIEGQLASSDTNVNEAYDNAHKVLKMYKEKFNWNSLDNQGMHVISSVHFGTKYENAFWDPQIRQMVYGDGGDFLYNFTKCLDVIGHEFTHAVTEHTSPLDYDGQAGALNEHCSDVFGIMCKQMDENETADNADWLIGEGCLMPGVKGVALRNMKAPGTAYNDRRFGKDPQPDNMSGYIATRDDNGGVHLNSGIPNKAFYNAAVAFGGYSWEKAGQIWWKGLNSGKIPPRCTFYAFADVMVETAEELFGDDAAKIVRKAWNDVGVVRKSHTH